MSSSRSLRFELALIIVLLLLLGVGGIAYKLWVLEFSLSPDSPATTWIVEAEVEFAAGEDGGPIEVELAIPEQGAGEILSEVSMAPGYGVTMDHRHGGRRVVWTRREASGTQRLFYRDEVFDVGGIDRRWPGQTPEIPPEPYWDQERRAAAESLVEEAHRVSAGPVSFAIQLLRRLSGKDRPSAVKLLLSGEPDLVRRSRLAIELLAVKGVAARLARAVPLRDKQRNQPILPLLEVHDGEGWRVLDPTTCKVGIPPDLLLWQRGNQPLLEVRGGTDSGVRLSVLRTTRHRSQLTAARIQDSGVEQAFFSLYALPVEHQNGFKILFLIPLGALIVCLARNVVGMRTSGTFMPVLIALAFFETTLGLGLVMFLVIVGAGLLARAYLAGFNLLLVPRISAVVTLVIGIMAFLTMLTHRMDLTQTVSVTFFPFVIIAWTIERTSVTWEERGRREALEELGGSVAVGAVLYLIWSNVWVQHIQFAFTEVNLIYLALILWLGTYTGYRLTEIFRFDPLVDPDEPEED